MAKRILFVLIALALAGAGLYYRSINAKTAQTLVFELTQQDTAAADTTATLASLKNYVKTHMGSSVKFTLSGAYARAQAAATAAAAATSANSQIYADAQRACGGKSDSLTLARCNEDYLAKHLTNVPVSTPVPAPKLSEFQYSLRAPIWTPDLAGALMVGAIASLAVGLFVIRKRRY
jgi:hypothetical protein